MIYLWIKALHILAVISWMAALLYLPRLFVYHAGTVPGSDQSETFKVMERRLLRAIATPAMLVSWVAGLWLAQAGGWFASPWFHAKLAAVVALTAVHLAMARAVRSFAADTNGRSSRFWRMVNEVPTLLMAGIVILVVVKPF